MVLILFFAELSYLKQLKADQVESIGKIVFFNAFQDAKKQNALDKTKYLKGDILIIIDLRLYGDDVIILRLWRKGIIW